MNLQNGYTENLSKFYQQGDLRINEVEISSLTNFNRELYSTYKALIWAVKDYMLSKKLSGYFHGIARVYPLVTI